MLRFVDRFLFALEFFLSALNHLAVVVPKSGRWGVPSAETQPSSEVFVIVIRITVWNIVLSSAKNFPKGRM